MSTSLRLHALFASLLGATAVAVGCNGTIATEADGGAQDGGTVLPDGAVVTDGAVLPDGAVVTDGGTLPPFELEVCLSEAESTYLFPKDATLATGVDFLGGYELGGDQGGKPSTIKASAHLVGKACATASDAAACEKALGTLDATTPYWGCNGFCPPFPGYQARTTKGDTVSVIGDRSKVKDAFLPIDTPSEALAAVTALHYAGCEPGKKNVKKHADGSYSVKAVESRCAQDPADPTKSIDSTDEVSYRVTASGAVTEEARVRVKEQKNDYGCPVAGRKPMGLVPANENGGSCAGQYFAKMAHLEAASVLAFAHMAEELRAHGAPEELVARAVAAIFDEQRHASAIGQLARERGARVPEVVAAAPRTRTLLEMAIENRREGCVRETYGALLAHYQAETSVDPHVRREMARIAHDETLHAALSWDLDTWLVSKLGEAERAQVREAEREAIRELTIECAQLFDAETRAVVGLPSPELAQSLFSSMRAGLGLAA